MAGIGTGTMDAGLNLDYAEVSVEYIIGSEGNFINGDGCNEVCQVEYGYTCTTPSVCTQ